MSLNVLFCLTNISYSVSNDLNREKKQILTLVKLKVMNHLKPSSNYLN